MTDLEKLKQTSFHDIGVDDLIIDFQHRRLALLLGFFNEDTRKFDAFKIDFQGIDNLSMNSLELSSKDFDALEIHSLTVTHTSGLLTVNFLMLTGHSRPSLALSFTFEEVRMS